MLAITRTFRELVRQLSLIRNGKIAENEKCIIILIYILPTSLLSQTANEESKLLSVKSIYKLILFRCCPKRTSYFLFPQIFHFFLKFLAEFTLRVSQHFYTHESVFRSCFLANFCRIFLNFCQIASYF